MIRRRRAGHNLLHAVAYSLDDASLGVLVVREPHPMFDTNVQPDEAIWRYFDLPRFMWLAQRRALYFSRANLLGDPLEGSYTKAREMDRSRLGPYDVQSALGAGGMGEVYRARDTKLGRDVALKILPASFTGDPERVARFRREAQVLASLNHPHIAQIHGLEDSNGSGGGGDLEGVAWHPA
jgi:hypothetical protein